ncbi:MAG: hemin-degrading factor [Acidobacteria bacterium]|nr:hemin-degrading factor [Acidobacteriota bacterium]
MQTATETTADLKERYREFSAENPKMRIRDAAEKLGVSEGELLATGVGENVIRLRPEFKELMHELHTLGYVMALTRNDEIVHERKGVYENAQTELPHGMALFVNPDIDLRIFSNCWKFGFAAEVENPRGMVKSIQIFDQDGSAVHKIYLTGKSDLEAYERLVARFKADDQPQTLEVSPKPPKRADLPDSEIDVEGFRKAWSEMKDTHDFFPMMGKFRVGRKQALRLGEEKFSREVPADSFKWMLEEARDRKIPIMVFVGNDGIIQIHTGEIENVLEARGWFNVMDEKFNLHIDQENVGSAFVVRKPTEDGIVTSLELFNKNDRDISLFFGKRKRGIPEKTEWRKLIEDLLKKNGIENMS